MYRRGNGTGLTSWYGKKAQNPEMVRKREREKKGEKTGGSYGCCRRKRRGCGQINPSNYSPAVFKKEKKKLKTQKIPWTMLFHTLGFQNNPAIKKRNK